MDIAIMRVDSALISKGVPMQIEKRLFKRFQVPDDALYIFCKDTSVKGWVTDISSGGMGFGYFSAESSLSKSEFKLILAGNKVSVYIPDISGKIVYDRSADKHERRYTGAGARQCGRRKRQQRDLRERYWPVLPGRSSGERSGCHSAA